MLQHIELLVESFGSTPHAGFPDFCPPLLSVSGVIDVSSCTGNRPAAVHRFQPIHDPRQVFDEVFDIELIFVQFRKVLELIAFSSLTANKDKYSVAYANFGVHWKAKSMLQAVGKLNPNFYPVPLGPPELLPNRTKLFTPLAE